MTIIRRLLRAPLLHFAIGGLLLFSAHRALQTPEPGEEGGRIELTSEDLRELSVEWMSLGHPPPTDEQLAGLVEDRIREEILYREALALGLDRGDAFIKRRLVRKMEFLSDDVPSVPEPSRDELQAWFVGHPARFTREAGAMPEFTEVRAEVRDDWIADQRAKARRVAYEALKARYTIVLPRGAP